MQPQLHRLRVMHCVIWLKIHTKSVPHTYADDGLTLYLAFHTFINFKNKKNALKCRLKSLKEMFTIILTTRYQTLFWSPSKILSQSNHALIHNFFLYGYQSRWSKNDCNFNHSQMKKNIDANSSFEVEEENDFCKKRKNNHQQHSASYKQY